MATVVPIFTASISARGTDRHLTGQQVADPLKGGILVGLGIFGQKLVGMKRAVRRPANDIGKGAAPVDPELPPAMFRRHPVHVMPAHRLNSTTLNVDKTSTICQRWDDTDKPGTG